MKTGEVPRLFSN